MPPALPYGYDSRATLRILQNVTLFVTLANCPPSVSLMECLLFASSAIQRDGSTAHFAYFTLKTQGEAGMSLRIITELKSAGIAARQVGRATKRFVVPLWGLGISEFANSRKDEGENDTFDRCIGVCRTRFL